jgi:hypothetical protein
MVTILVRAPRVPVVTGLTVNQRQRWLRIGRSPAVTVPQVGARSCPHLCKAGVEGSRPRVARQSVTVGVS